MKISLPEYAKLQEIQHVTLILDERLPSFVNGKLVLDCQFQVKKHENGFIFSVKSQGNPEIICQRCLNLFKYDYFYSNDLLICNNDEVASTKMQEYECISVKSHNIVIDEILIDDLHLFLPDKHPENECSFEFLEKYLN